MQNNGFHNDIFSYSWLLISPSPSLSVPHPILIFLVPFSLPDCPRYYFPGPCIQSYSLYLSKDSTPHLMIPFLVSCPPNTNLNKNTNLNMVIHLKLALGHLSFCIWFVSLNTSIYQHLWPLSASSHSAEAELSCLFPLHSSIHQSHIHLKPHYLHHP